MGTVTTKPQIKDTFEKVRLFSFEEKKEAILDEKKINQLLDKILEFKKSYSKKTSSIENLVERIEKITWFDELDQESLMIVNDLISSIRDFYSTLIRQYRSLEFFISKGIAVDEIKQFKAAIDDLRDVANDLESRFFFLPSNDDFIEITKELSLL